MALRLPSRMTPLGGSIQGVPVLRSDSIEPDEVMLIDANGIAASAGTVAHSPASHATVRISSNARSDIALTIACGNRNNWATALSEISAAHASATTPWRLLMASITRTRRRSNMAISKESMATLMAPRWPRSSPNMCRSRGSRSAIASLSSRRSRSFGTAVSTTRARDTPRAPLSRKTARCLSASGPRLSVPVKARTGSLRSSVAETERMHDENNG